MIDLSETLKKLNNELSRTNIGDFCIYHYSSRPSLLLVGSFDFSYYHNVEIAFNEVSFVICPGGIFTVDHFRLATKDELQRLYEVSYGYNDTPTICLEDTTFNTKFFIAASEVNYSFQNVYYYKKESLAENERIADWVT
ncbi:hypothetical protein EBB07_31200 [Paenibacillaceae bacterium]|nr:hypothetical protein EBB07_31200 [Paenibacillaceae bacterium]